jgi:hypothetical protein
MPKVVPVSDTELSRQNKEVADRCVRATVTGDQPIRDAITRESVETGGIVHLDPKTTIIDHLVSAGAISLTVAEAKA